MATMTRTIGTVSAQGKVNKTNVALWVTQSALALVFFAAGSSKLVMSAEQMSANSEIDLALNDVSRVLASALARTSDRASSCTRRTSSSVTARTSGGSESRMRPFHTCARCSARGACTISGPVNCAGLNPLFT